MNHLRLRVILNMLLFDVFKIKIFNYAKFLRRNLCLILQKNKPLCHIEEIDMTKKIIIVYSRGVAAPIKFTFDEIIQDVAVISNLSSQQASWVGYYYGICYQRELDAQKNNKIKNKIEFSLSNSEKKYKIMHQNRSGNLTYLDTDHNKIYTKSIINILAIPSLIMEFDPIEACYIGILGGIFIFKSSSEKIINFLPSKVSLKLIK